MSGAEVWRGGVNAWECDEMGHMNVRFHLARALEGLGGLARLMDLPHAFRRGAGSTLVVREVLIRFLREAHAGSPLSLDGAVTRMGERDADVALVLGHGDGGAASAFQLRVEHATPEGAPFPWPGRVRRAAEALTAPPSPEAQPRSLAFGDDPPVAASLAAADALGLTCITRGLLSDAGCDAHGFMRADEFLGRVSDGAARLMMPVREAAAAEQGEAAPMGGAVVEYRILVRERPRAGDHLEMRSGLMDIGPRVARAVHWMLDPVSGRPWISSEAVVVCFDLRTRKAVRLSDAAIAGLQPHVTAGLSL